MNLLKENLKKLLKYTTVQLPCLSLLFAAVYILIGAGGIMMLVGFFGCCGAVRESQCLLGLVGKSCVPLQ